MLLHRRRRRRRFHRRREAPCPGSPQARRLCRRLCGYLRQNQDCPSGGVASRSRQPIRSPASMQCFRITQNSLSQFKQHPLESGCETHQQTHARSSNDSNDSCAAIAWRPAQVVAGTGLQQRARLRSARLPRRQQLHQLLQQNLPEALLRCHLYKSSQCRQNMLGCFMLCVRRSQHLAPAAPAAPLKSPAPPPPVFTGTCRQFG